MFKNLTGGLSHWSCPKPFGSGVPIMCTSVVLLMRLFTLAVCLVSITALASVLQLWCATLRQCRNSRNGWQCCHVCPHTCCCLNSHYQLSSCASSSPPQSKSFSSMFPH
jgi:hypothetical protein